VFCGPDVDRAPDRLVILAASGNADLQPPEPFGLGPITLASDRLTRDDRASKSRGALLCQAFDDIRDGSPYYMSQSCFA
jgi:hypothetical protein